MEIEEMLHLSSADQHPPHRAAFLRGDITQ